MTTIKLTMPEIRESMLIRCNLSDASSPVQVDYCEGGGWTGCQYQAADARHSTAGLIAIGEQLFADAIQEQVEDCEIEAGSGGSPPHPNASKGCPSAPIANGYPENSAAS